MTSAMTLQRMSELAEAYGADLRRWPAEARAAAQAMMADDPVGGERVLADARAIDDLLHASPTPSVSVALRDKVLASAMAAGLSPKKARVILNRLGLLFGAGWAAAACAGVVAGANLTLHMTADARADAVLYQASLSGVDDTEVLG